MVTQKVMRPEKNMEVVKNAPSPTQKVVYRSTNRILSEESGKQGFFIRPSWLGIEAKICQDTVGNALKSTLLLMFFDLPKNEATEIFFKAPQKMKAEDFIKILENEFNFMSPNFVKPFVVTETAVFHQVACPGNPVVPVFTPFCGAVFAIVFTQTQKPDFKKCGRFPLFLQGENSGVRVSVTY